MVSPWFKTQHLISFQVILPLLFDFTVRRHIYLTTYYCVFDLSGKNRKIMEFYLFIIINLPH